MAKGDHLFTTYDLRAVLEGHERKTLEEIDAIGQKELLGLNVEELCDYYEQEYTVAAPKLNEERITVEQAEVKIDVSQDRGRAIFDRSQPFYITGTGISTRLPRGSCRTYVLY
jgi:hypothetical protein